MKKTITVTPTDPQDSSLRDLTIALEEVDPEIEVAHRVALSGPTWGDEVVRVVLDHGLTAATTLLVAAVTAWAQSWFKKKPKAKRVLLYGPNLEVLVDIDRDDHS